MSALSASLFPRKTARHAKPAAAPKILLAGGLTAAFAVTDLALVTGPASATATNSAWERLAECESGGNWAINTGNGYYGGLQFALGTWRGLGFGGYPHQASKSTQIAAANKLHSQRGFAPWPACSRKLGLRGDGGGATVAQAPAVRAAKPQPAPAAKKAGTTAQRREAAARASRNRAASAAAAKAAAAARAQRIAAIRALKVTAPPRFDGHVLSVADRSGYRIAVKHWQRRMAARGWSIDVDGYFGPQSARVAAAFARDKKVSTTPGSVDKQLWDLAWSSPVTL